MNEYEKAIYEVGNVITPYLQNKMFAAFGFGGIPRYAGINEVSSCWPLNGNVEPFDPYVKGTEGLLQSYHKGIAGTTLAGPTYFAKILTLIYD